MDADEVFNSFPGHSAALRAPSGENRFYSASNYVILRAKLVFAVSVESLFLALAKVHGTFYCA